MAYCTSTLAQGCFGKVYKMRYNDTWAAVKKVPRELIEKKDLERECEVYNLCEHPNIVKLLGNITLSEGKWIIPLEFIFGEDLETTIFDPSKSKIKLTPSVKNTIIIGMCEGLRHLHSKDVVHQDLKPENIMVEHKTNRAVIIDLGLAKFFRYGLNSAWDMGNEAYSAPEVLRRGMQRNQRSDFWAMGKIIGELCAQARFHTPNVCPAMIREKLNDHPYCRPLCRMVEPDPSHRATMSGIINYIREAADTDSRGRKRFVVEGDSDAVGPKDYRPPLVTDGRYKPPSPTGRCASPMTRDPTPLQRDRFTMNTPAPPSERSPKPEWQDNLKTRLQMALVPKWAQNKDTKLQLSPEPDPTDDFAKMQLQDGAKNHLFNWQRAGQVKMTHIEETKTEEKHQYFEFTTRKGQVMRAENFKINQY